MPILLTSCISQMFPSEANYEKVYIGMGIQDFMKSHNKALNEYMDNNTQILSIQYYKKNNGKAVAEVEDVTYRKFYYFTQNKLTRVDKGERAIDYRIKIDH